MGPLEELREAASRLPQGLARHIAGVAAEARRLARRHGVDEERTTLAAWGHDIARAMSAEELLAAAQGYGLDISPVEAAAPILLHGPVAAEILARRFSISDQEVLEAVRWHTTGSADMSPLAKVVLVADKIEIGKVQQNLLLAAVRTLAPDDLDAALLEYLGQSLEESVRLGRMVHPQVVTARNHLLLTRRGSA